MLKCYTINSWLNLWIQRDDFKVIYRVSVQKVRVVQTVQKVRAPNTHVDQRSTVWNIYLLHLWFKITWSYFLDAQRILSLFWRSLVLPRTSCTLLYIQVFYFWKFAWIIIFEFVLFNQTLLFTNIYNIHSICLLYIL